MGRKPGSKKPKDPITSGAAGTEGVRDEWNKAAEMAGGALLKDKVKTPVQARLDLGDEVIEFHEIEIEIAVSVEEAHLLDAQATAALVEKAALEVELADLREQVKAKAAEVKEKQAFAAARAKESKDRKRQQKQRVKVVYHPTRATKHYLDPVTNKPVRPSEPMDPADVKRLEGGEPSPDDAPPESAPLDPPPEES